MQRAGDRDATSVMYRLSRRLCSTRAAKIRIMQGGSAGPGGTRRIAHIYAASRHRTRVGKMGSDDTRRMARSGLVSHAGGDPPAVTPVGRWSAMAYGLGITFFEMCVLAKVYGVARSMAGTGVGWGEGAGGGDGARTATIPLRTVQYFFEDWPVYPGRVQHALSRLRGRGLIPRSRYKRVACDAERLEAIRGELSEVDKWVDDTGEEMRRVLLHGY
ncbi:MAG: hypothetical protein OXP12_00335 [Thaumarchaeota archaeon]|nr:hypothetical protein [Nitrososphaerota archaeon]